jgi:hypothetical protein
MKLTNLIGVLALAGSVAACNTGSPISGCTIDPTTGLCSAGGDGDLDCGPIEDACTNAEDTAVYDNLTYINDIGDTFTGTDAASEIGSDCIFGSDPAPPSLADPRLDGCGTEAGRVIACFPNCPDCNQETPPETCGQACTENQDCGLGFTCLEGTCTDAPQAGAVCVARCTKEATTAASPPGLSDDCLSCTGGSVACGAAFCTTQCVADANAPICIECRCANNCIQCNDVCTGLPSDNECG